MKLKARFVISLSICVLLLGGLACTTSLLQLPTIPSGPTSVPTTILPSPTPEPRAKVTFTAVLPEPLGPGESLYMNVMDEVTGLALNASTYPMQAKDNLTYTATLPLPLNAIVKYRYIRQASAPVSEDTAIHTPIRYRLYYVAGQGEVQDLIGGWSDKNYTRQLGAIQGRVLNTDTGAPIPNILVTAAGVQSITDSAGRFDLEGLPIGVNNLVAYAMDGAYQTFQQGAAVAASLSTAVEIHVKAAPLVKITFNVAAPTDTVQGAPIRIAGNLLELGNTFADLQGGVSTVADRMPIMSLQPDGHYSVTISLPVGAYVQYKYTLGDGFLNAEHKSTGEFVLRKFIVPAQDTLIQDAIDTWHAGASAPILFQVTVPSTTPAGDIVYIQLNPYGWTEPIPMWPLGNNQWVYRLYSPLNMLGTFHYRYCRNGQCGSADDSSTTGANATGHELSTSLTPQDVQDDVSSWAWLGADNTSLVGAQITARQNGFVGGIEFQPDYRPNWSYYYPQTLQTVRGLGANWVFMTPSWTFSDDSPLTFLPMPGTDPLWMDSAIMISQARSMNLNVGIFPIPHFITSNADDFWKSAPRDANWWQDWFDHYRAFADNYADLATQSGAQMLVLGGGTWINPALPSGTLLDGTPSGVPNDADARWKAIIAEVRQHFNGKILWALPYTPGKLLTSLSFFQDVDGIYLLWSAPLATQSGASKTDLLSQAGKLLDNEVSPLPSLLNKPIIIALAYPSASGVEVNCISDSKGGCLDWLDLNQPNNPPSASVDLQSQYDLYEAMLNAVNTRPWVGGIVSRGFYPPAALQDKSASVHGKPAADLLWYWFPRLLGITK
ncbi:MAG TPA: carboxypeptidase regulatory-like domain-containing protein [Anaerolineales bacterium]|nr:carboxypeptidase regulatory-like domain-containing protein [Anaerolineales bacterium]